MTVWPKAEVALPKTQTLIQLQKLRDKLLQQIMLQLTHLTEIQPFPEQTTYLSDSAQRKQTDKMSAVRSEMTSAGRKHAGCGSETLSMSDYALGSSDIHCVSFSV